MSKLKVCTANPLKYNTNFGFRKTQENIQNARFATGCLQKNGPPTTVARRGIQLIFQICDLMVSWASFGHKLIQK